MRIIQLKEIIDRAGLARSTIYKYTGGGIFLRPVSLASGGTDVPNTRGVGWIESEVED